KRNVQERRQRPHVGFGPIDIPSLLVYSANSLMKDAGGKLNIRYLGFESTSDGGRRLRFSLTAPGRSVTQVQFDIPSNAFNGNNRISFQESAALCYEKLRDVVEREGEIRDAHLFLQTEQDIHDFRPRGRRAAARSKE